HSRSEHAAGVVVIQWPAGDLPGGRGKEMVDGLRVTADGFDHLAQALPCLVRQQRGDRLQRGVHHVSSRIDAAGVCAVLIACCNAAIAAAAVTGAVGLLRASSTETRPW